MSFTMNQTEFPNLQKLLSTFEVSGLGEGDINSGANLLAAMSVALANIAPTGNSVCHPDGTPARLGTSLLISGALSSGRIIDEVITEVGRRQSNLTKHLRKYSEWIAAQAAKPGASLPPTGLAGSATDGLLAEVLSDIEPLSGNRQELMGQILDRMPAECFQDFATHPKLLVSAARARDLDSQLKGLRPGRPLIHLGINHSSDLAELAEPGAALIEGRYPIGSGCEIIRGNFLVTDPLRLLSEAAKAPDQRTSWLGHFLWLVDGEAGPEAPGAAQTASQQHGAHILGRFRQALGVVMASRVNLEGSEPRKLRFDTRAAAPRWTSFLKEMEPGMPGISGAARNLLNSLLFGLQMIAAADAPLSFTMAEVESFCRFLVHRAVNARITIIHAAEVARLRSQAETIYRKIEQGHDRRKICKDTGIPAADFDERVLWLEEAGILQRSAAAANHWVKVEGARPDFRNCRLPLPEINRLKS